MSDYKEIRLRICPHCKESFNVNGNTMANHIRWCKKNPDYEKILKNTKSKCKYKNIERNKKLYDTYVINCEYCGKEIVFVCSKKQYERGSYKRTCSNECAKKLTSIKGKSKKLDTWSKKSKSIKDKNRDKNPEYYIHQCTYCNKSFESKYKSIRKFCSLECCKKYRFDKFSRNKSKKEIYSKLCQFRFALNEFPNEFNFELIKKQGWYKAKNHGDNLYGASRDHIVSIKYGFEHNIDPYIISHPANCQLLIQTENESKSSKCDITIEELETKIEKWNKKYGEYPNKINDLIKSLDDQ